MRRFTLFDAAILVFVLVMIPIAYGTYLLFRPAHPQITSVRRLEITREERLTGGQNLAARLKVEGSGFRPLLRATVGETPAIAFIFQTPNTAEVQLSPVPPGPHDLILYDGVQEVARLRNGVSIDPTPSRPAMLRVRLESPTEVTRLITVGDRDVVTSPNAAIVTAIDRDTITVRVGAVPVDDGWQYYDADLKPGVPFTLTTKRYVVKGVVLTVTMEDRP